MRNALALCACALFASALHCSRDANAETSREATPRETTPRAAGAHVPVVIELFTSEGCSSCPPADDALASFSSAARADGVEVVPLAFHVDYWNYLGWSDPFSSAMNSDRQRLYSSFLSGRVYTPQAVVDGRVDLVGSDRAALERAIVDSAKTAKADVTLNARADGRAVTIDATSNALAPGAETLFAITQARANVDVPRGENGGRKLAHTSIVRAFETARPDAEHHARATLTLPESMPRDGARVIAVVYDASTKRVLGASTRAL
jgi:hypothetical protein